MSVRMRHTHEHTANRRSHHALKEPRLSTCKDCGEKHLRHHMCETCGKYKSREVVDVAAKTEKRMARIAARRASEGQETATKAEAPQDEEVTETKAVKKEAKNASKASPKDKGTNIETKKENK